MSYSDETITQLCASIMTIAEASAATMDVLSHFSA